jgi:putative addiction module antidote
MSSSVTIRKNGNSIGIALPAETRIRLGLEVGQELTLVELSDGIKLVKRNLELERQMDAAREVLREQADVLQELAKR